jgi:hypothetical protein
MWMTGLLMGCLATLPATVWAQTPKKSAAAPTPGRSVVTVEQQDAQRTREQLSQLLEHYPPTLRGVLELDPALLDNEAYLAPYPGLQSFLNDHPEVARNPMFFIGEGQHSPRDPATQAVDMWRNVIENVGIFVGFGMAIGVLVWLVRTLVDYRRWIRLSKVQTDVHTKILDRLTSNNDLLAYIQSPAGSKFLESSPIKLDAGPRSMGAPLARILWSLQGGLVLCSGGIGLEWVGARVANEVAQPFHILGVLAIALGIGFIVSAILSYVLSVRLGLIDTAVPANREEPPAV